MPRLLSSFIMLVSLTSRVSLVTCRATEGESFKRQTLSDSIWFSNEFVNPQTFSEADSVNLGGTDLEFPDDFTETSPLPFETSSESSPFLIAEEPLCPGAFRYPYCCGANGCTLTTTCQLGETLNCCTAEPNGVTNCTPLKPKRTSSFTSPLIGLSNNGYTENFLPSDSWESVPDINLDFTVWSRLLQIES